MSKYFNEVATPQVATHQSNSKLQGPTKDVKSRREAQDAKSNSSSLGNAIQSLIRTSVSVAEVADQASENHIRRLDSKFGIEVDKITEDAGSSQDKFYRKKIAEDDSIDSIHDLSKEQLESYREEFKTDYMKTKGLVGKAFQPLAEERLDKKSRDFVVMQDANNKRAKKEKSYKDFGGSIVNNLVKPMELTNDIEADGGRLVEMFKTKFKTSVGDSEDFEIQATHDEAFNEVMTPVVAEAVRTGNRKLFKLFNTKAFKEYATKSMTEFPQAMNIMQQKQYSLVAKNKKQNYNIVKENGSVMLSNGGFKTLTQIKTFVKESAAEQDPDFRMTNVQQEDLIAKFAKGMGKTNTFDQIALQLDKGNHTAVHSADLTDKEEDEFDDFYMNRTVGFSDLSGGTIIDTINSGQVDDTVPAFADKGRSYGPSLINAFEEILIPKQGETSLEAGGRQAKAFTSMLAETQGTINPISDHISTEAKARMSYHSRLNDNIVSGVMDVREAQEALNTYNTEFKKNLNSDGIFVSKKSSEATTDDIVEDIDDFSKDADWTPDDYINSEFIAKTVKHDFNLYIDSGDEPDDALDKAQKGFKSKHTRLENPDGTHAAISKIEFGANTPDDMLEFALEHPRIKSKNKKGKKWANLYNHGWSMDDNLGFHPVSNFGKTKLFEIYYNGRPVAGTKFSGRDLKRGLKKIRAEKKLAIEKADREKFK